MSDLKKSLAIVTAICSIGVISTLPVSANINADIDGDEEVSEIDMLLVKKNIFNIIPQTYFKFDINNDGFVNVIDMNLVKRELATETELPVTNPPQIEPSQINPPITQPSTTEPDYSGGTLVDGHGNVYPAKGYEKRGKVVMVASADSNIAAQNHANAIEEFYGIPMIASGHSIYPACFDDLSVTGTLEELNVWRQGRSPVEIGPAEISANWALIGNDIDFYIECFNYLVNELQL